MHCVHAAVWSVVWQVQNTGFQQVVLHSGWIKVEPGGGGCRATVGILARLPKGATPAWLSPSFLTLCWKSLFLWLILFLFFFFLPHHFRVFSASFFTLLRTSPFNLCPSFIKFCNCSHAHSLIFPIRLISLSPFFLATFSVPSLFLNLHSFHHQLSLLLRLKDKFALVHCSKGFPSSSVCFQASVWQRGLFRAWVGKCVRVFVCLWPRITSEWFHVYVGTPVLFLLRQILHIDSRSFPKELGTFWRTDRRKQSLNLAPEYSIYPQKCPCWGGCSFRRYRKLLGHRCCAASLVQRLVESLQYFILPMFKSYGIVSSKYHFIVLPM